MQCWRCATWLAMIVGMRAGRRSECVGSRKSGASDTCKPVRPHARPRASRLLPLRKFRTRRPNAPGGSQEEWLPPSSKRNQHKWNNERRATSTRCLPSLATPFTPTPFCLMENNLIYAKILRIPRFLPIPSWEWVSMPKFYDLRC